MNVKNRSASARQRTAAVSKYTSWIFCIVIHIYVFVAEKSANQQLSIVRRITMIRIFWIGDFSTK